MATIDLTRINKITPQTRPLVKINNSKTNSANSVFTEVMFGDLRCCYLANADINPNNGDLYTADIGTMMLPSSFMHLAFDVVGKQVISPSSGNLFNPEESAYIPRDESVFTQLLLVHSNANTANEVIKDNSPFHICDDLRSTHYTLGAHGCADVKGLLNKTLEHLFYHEGDVLLATMMPNEANATELTSVFKTDILKDAHVFLLPFLLSEKMVAYYAIDAKVSGWKTNIEEWFSSGTSPVSISTPMLYNDDLGVFITSDAKRALPKVTNS